VHVEGRMASGRLPDFAEAVERYQAYAAANGYAVPHVLLDLSGLMPQNSALAMSPSLRSAIAWQYRVTSTSQKPRSCPAGTAPKPTATAMRENG
jgi:hypothetical protein